MGIQANRSRSKTRKNNGKTATLVVEERILRELAFFAALVNSSDDAIISKTLDGAITSWNPAAEKTFGYSSKEVIGKPISILIPLTLQQEEKKIIEQIRRGKVVDHYETKRIRKDGVVIDVSLIISPIKDSTGTIIGASKILRDITDRKKTESDFVHVSEDLEVSLKEAEDYKHALDESSIVAITEKTGRIKYVNDNFCKISKYSREELIGEDHRIINSGYHPKEFIRDLWSTISQGKIWKGELKNKAKDGSIYWVDTTIVPFLDEQGKPYQYVAIRSEITNRKKAEEEVIKAYQENETVLNRISDGVVSVDNEWRYTFLNDAALSTNPTGREETLGKVIWDVHPELEGTVFWEKYHQAMLTKKVMEIEGFYPSMDAWFSAKVYPSFDGLTIFYKDVTESRKAELKLSQSLREITDYKHALDESSIVAITDPRGVITYVNDNFCKISKYGREELLGEDDRIINSGYHTKEFIRDLWSTISRGKIWKGELKNKAKDGSTYWVDSSIVPFLDPHGEPYQYLAIHTEISSRKKAEDELKQLNESLEQKVIERTHQLSTNLQHLKESEEKFQKAFHASGGGITLTRLSDSIYMEVNEAFVQITGYTREELIGHSSIELGMVSNLKRRQDVLQEINEHGSARNFEITVRHKSGRLLEVISSIETILLKGEKYAINIIYDITDRKLAEEQLKVANKELESFSYSVSHDLRAPLRAIHGNAKILEEDYLEKFDVAGLSALQSIMRNSLRMGTLIDDLLAFSKLGRKYLTASDINMMTLVQSTIEEFLTDAVRDRTEIHVDRLPPAKGDQSLIKQVWVNLLSNAIKYSRTKTKTEIKIGAHEKDGMVVYHIEDNGVGFDMQYYDKLFGVFQRLHSQEEFEGTGIGLANVQKIVHRHHGTVWAESTPPEGTCFYFSLPGVRSQDFLT